MARPVVLLAEDDPSVRMTIEFVLDDEGFDVVIAEDGEQALSLARDRKPDAILLDRIMPKMDGRDVYAALRRDDSTRNIPVIVITGMVRDDSDDWQGAHFVGKPFSPDDLVHVLRTLIGP